MHIANGDFCSTETHHVLININIVTQSLTFSNIFTSISGNSQTLSGYLGMVIFLIVAVRYCEGLRRGSEWFLMLQNPFGRGPFSFSGWRGRFQDRQINRLCYNVSNVQTLHIWRRCHMTIIMRREVASVVFNQWIFNMMTYRLLWSTMQNEELNKD
jgi:hypothetical protein